jgi:AcrR family transcriptional regulator
MTAPTRRIGSEDSETRTALLDAAEQLILEEGYAAATSRRVAARAGLKPQLVHYYFRTMDDLFLALVRRGAERNLERQARALASPNPLRALWEISCDPSGSAMTMELSALSNHRKAIQAELSTYGDRFRALQSDALAGLLSRDGDAAPDIPPDVLSFLITSVSQILVMEEKLGMSRGHAELRAMVERYLDRFEGGGAEPADPEPSG